MKSLLKIIYIIVSFNTMLFAQMDSSKIAWEFLPSGLHLLPLKGNNQEARIGVLYYPSDANLKVDIGNSIDLVKLETPGEMNKLTFGIEFLAYAYSTSFKGNRLQIDAVDGLFGGNATFSTKIGYDRLFTRLRLIHNSAHFVDGHYDLALHEWIGNKEPIPYTRDFGELLFIYERHRQAYTLKLFGGPTYSTLVRPSTIKKLSASGGFEYALFNPFGRIFRQDESIFAATYTTYMGIPEYMPNHNLLLGIKFGNWYEKGIILYLNYYTGNNIFSEYYKERTGRFGIGFSVDFN